MKNQQTTVHHKRMPLPDTATLALWPLVEQYGQHLQQRGCKPNSVYRAKSNLKRFCAFAHELGRRKPAEITAFDLESYPLSLAAMTPRSQQQYLIDVRQFFGWLEDTQQLFVNPAEKLRIPKAPRPPLRVPTEEQVARLLDAPDLKTMWGLRDRAWLEVAYATGARRIEMTRLTVADVNLQHGLLRLLGKGDKERLAPLGGQAIRWLEKYLDESRPKLLKGKTHTALWLSTRGGPWGYAAIQEQLDTYARKIGLPKSLLTAHNLRRACVSHMLHHGASPLLLKELLGHVRTATLSHYLRQSMADLQETHRHTSPGK
jgi:integrase/recombinase XerD